jgi:hypothetical protein
VADLFASSIITVIIMETSALTEFHNVQDNMTLQLEIFTASSRHSPAPISQAWAYMEQVTSTKSTVCSHKENREQVNANTLMHYLKYHSSWN